MEVVLTIINTTTGDVEIASSQFIKKMNRDFQTTHTAAGYVGLDKDYGSIIKGKPADLVLVEGDPTKDITNIRKTLLVISQEKSLILLLYNSISIKHP